jgi:hypothetical protein
MTMTSNRNRLAWLAIATVVVLGAWLSLQRVQEERLFLVRLPFDRVPLDVECRDAAASARRWTFPALLFLTITGVATIASVQVGPLHAFEDSRRKMRALVHAHSVLSSLFALACLSDFLSTLWYFHQYSLEDELHPGIKLVTYAWGLTVGCLAAKLIQGSLVLFVCAVFPRISRPTLIVTTIAYVFAAFWNLGLFG